MRAKNYLIHSFLFFSIIFCQSDADEWTLVSSEPEHTINGIVPLDSGMLVAHDNKRRGEPRIGLVSWNSHDYRELKWPSDKLPFDLEGLDMIPGKKNEMIAMESTGKCYRLFYDQGRRKLVFKREFQIPEVTRSMNLEGIAFCKVGRKTLVAWGDRGSDDRPGRLHWGWLTYYGSKIEPLGSYSFTVNFPEKDVRHLSDVKITEEGVCWISADSDPGDEGPFDSAVYKLGSFNLDENPVVFNPEKTVQPFLKFRGHKVEAIMIHAGKLINGTDDENYGGSILFHNLE